MTILVVLLILVCASSGIAAFVLMLLGFRVEVDTEGFGSELDFSYLVIGAGCVVAVTAFLLTDLVSLSLAAGLAVFLVRSLFLSRLARKRVEDRVEAVAVFAQSLSDSIGGGKSISEAIRAAAVSPPKAIFREVKELQVGLSTATFDDAVSRFVTVLDDPAGDLLGAHVLQANSYATASLGETMRSISETLNDHIVAGKKVATGRRRQEFEIKGLSVVLVFMIVGLFVMAPDLLEVYQRDLVGELKLSVVFGFALAGWVVTDRLTASVDKSEFSLRREVTR